MATYKQTEMQKKKDDEDDSLCKYETQLSQYEAGNIPTLLNM